MDTLITCPNCKKEIPLSDAFKHEIEAGVLAAERTRHQREMGEAIKAAETAAVKKASDHPSNNLAKLPFDPSVRVPRTRLRPCYGDGFDGAPLMGRRPRGEGRAVGGGADDPARSANPASAGAGES